MTVSTASGGGSGPLGGVLDSEAEAVLARPKDAIDTTTSEMRMRRIHEGESARSMVASYGGHFCRVKVSCSENS